MNPKKNSTFFLSILYSFAVVLVLVSACTRSTDPQKEQRPAPMNSQTPAASSAVIQNAPAVDPLEPWDPPAVPEFSPEIRIFLIHNAYTAWNRRTCSGAFLENLRQTLAQLKPETLWVGPDSLAPRPLDADLREGAPPQPLEWVKFLRENGVSWMALGKSDLELGREKLSALARETGMRFIADAEGENGLSPCITETHKGKTLAACVLSESAREPSEAWKRLRERIAGAQWVILFTSGSPAWQKKLENLPEPPDVIVSGGMQSLPHGQTGPGGQIRVAVGGDLQNVGELGLTQGNATPPSTALPAAAKHPFLASDAENILEERARMEASFRNLAQILADPRTDPQRRDVFARRMASLRAEWGRLKSRAIRFRQMQTETRRVLFRVHAVAACGAR